MNKRRRVYHKQYSLDYLLSRQPRHLIKTTHYSQLLMLLRTDFRLRQLRFNRKCYSLLHNARISADNLNTFYKAYHLPKHPFFPLFLNLKTEYLLHRKKLKKERETYIKNKIQSLSPDVKAALKSLARLEQIHHKKNLYPLWVKYLFPGSKKKADQLAGYSWTDWAGRFNQYEKRLKEKYPGMDNIKGKCIIALFILGLPQGINPAGEIKNRFRTLCKRYHPDTGGTAEEFHLLQWAKEILLTEKIK